MEKTEAYRNHKYVVVKCIRISPCKEFDWVIELNLFAKLVPFLGNAHRVQWWSTKLDILVTMTAKPLAAKKTGAQDLQALRGRCSSSRVVAGARKPFSSPKIITGLFINPSMLNYTVMWVQWVTYRHIFKYTYNVRPTYVMLSGVLFRATNIFPAYLERALSKGCPYITPKMNS